MKFKEGISEELKKVLEDNNLLGVGEFKEEYYLNEDNKLVSTVVLKYEVEDRVIKEEFTNTLKVKVKESKELDEVYIGGKKVKDLSPYMQRAFLPKYKTYAEVVRELKEVF